MCIMRLLDVGGTNLAQWRHKMPIYYGWRWHGMLTTERQQYSENPGGTPRQCISVCPWKLAQPIAGYRRNTRLILNPQWHKRLHAAYFYFLFVLALFAKYLILFSRITGIRHLTWLDTLTWNMKLSLFLFSVYHFSDSCVLFILIFFKKNLRIFIYIIYGIFFRSLLKRLTSGEMNHGTLAF